MLTFLSMISIFVVPPLFAAEASLDTIVVTATRTDEDVEKLPSSITVVTAEDISNSTAVTVQDVLENVEGLVIRDLYGTGAKSTVDGRGFARGVNTVVLIDGRRVNEIDLGGVDWNLIPLENVERIEIVRGAGKRAFYGDNATSGVINIITKKGKTETTSVDIEGRIESFSGSSEHLSISGGGGKIQLLSLRQKQEKPTDTGITASFPRRTDRPPRPYAGGFILSRLSKAERTKTARAIPEGLPRRNSMPTELRLWTP